MPGYIDAPHNIPMTEFASFDELLSHPWIKHWSEGDKKDFGYYWNENNGRWSKAVLMAQWFDEDKKDWTWWVLGYMDEIPTNIPEWKNPKKENK
jgi:hypothetical protein